MARYLERLSPQAVKYTTIPPAKVFAVVSLESTSSVEMFYTQSDSEAVKTQNLVGQEKLIAV